MLYGFDLDQLPTLLAFDAGEAFGTFLLTFFMVFCLIGEAIKRMDRGGVMKRSALQLGKRGGWSLIKHITKR